MKKYLIPSFIFLVSCNQKKQNDKNITKSITEDSIEILANKAVDSAIRSVHTNDDFKGSFSNKKIVKNYPVEVLSAEFIKRSYSNYKDVRIKYKNVSDKKIEAIRFEWYGENAFGEPADMGTSDGKGQGFTDDPIHPGKSDSGVWSVLSSDGKKIIGARAYEVVFSNGTKWNLY